MNTSDANELATSWGEKLCDHPDIIGKDNDDADIWYCTQCGKPCDYDTWIRSSGIGN